MKSVLLITSFALLFSSYLNSNLNGIELSHNLKTAEKYTINCSNLLFNIINNPIKILRENNKEREFIPGLKDFEKKTESHPIGLLYECQANLCPLNRIKFPQRRELVERKILKYIQEYFPSKEKKLIYTSLGPGGLFQDLVILTKLINMGYNDITVILIELEFKNYIEVVRGKKLINFDQFANAVITHYQLMQFSAFLKNCSQEKIKILIYDNFENYIIDCESDSSLKCDVFWGIDCFDGDASRKASQDIDYLTFLAQKPNGLSFIVDRKHMWTIKKKESFYSTLEKLKKLKDSEFDKIFKKNFKILEKFDHSNISTGKCYLTTIMSKLLHTS